LIRGMIDALQEKTLVKEVENAIPDTDLRTDDVELLFVRKLRLSYAEHLANMCVRMHEMYQFALPVELNLIKLRATVYRHMGPLLIEIAKAEELLQKDVIALFSGQTTPRMMAAINALVGAEPDDLLVQLGQQVVHQAEVAEGSDPEAVQ